jgi:hypothetical protein
LIFLVSWRGGSTAMIGQLRRGRHFPRAAEFPFGVKNLRRLPAALTKHYKKQDNTRNGAKHHSGGFIPAGQSCGARDKRVASGRTGL